MRRAGSRAGQERGFPGASEGLNQRLRSVCRLFACLAWAGHPPSVSSVRPSPGRVCLCTQARVGVGVGGGAGRETAPRGAGSARGWGLHANQLTESRGSLAL